MLRENSTAEVVKLLLPILDNFELARSSIHPGSDKEETINNAYQSIYKQIVDILKGVGVVPIKTAGELFDPELHDAVSQLPDNDLPEDSVKTELRRGFTINGRLLRPAMVQVSCQFPELLIIPVTIITCRMLLRSTSASKQIPILWIRALTLLSYFLYYRFRAKRMKLKMLIS